MKWTLISPLQSVRCQCIWPLAFCSRLRNAEGSRNFVAVKGSCWVCHRSKPASIKAVQSVHPVLTLISGFVVYRPPSFKAQSQQAVCADALTMASIRC